jgi:hypothetical protein
MGIFDDFNTDNTISAELTNSEITNYLADEETIIDGELTEKSGGNTETFSNIFSIGVGDIIQDKIDDIKNYDPAVEGASLYAFSDYDLLSEDQRKSLVTEMTKTLASDIYKIDDLDIKFGDETKLDVKNKSITFDKDLLRSGLGYDALHEIALNLNKEKMYEQINSDLESGKITNPLIKAKLENEKTNLETTLSEPYESLKLSNIIANQTTNQQFNALSFRMDDNFNEYNVEMQENYNADIIANSKDLLSEGFTRNEIDSLISKSNDFEINKEASTLSGTTVNHTSESHSLFANDLNSYNIDIDKTVMLVDGKQKNIWNAKVKNERGDSFDISLKDGKCFISGFNGDINLLESADMANVAYQMIGIYKAKTGEDITNINADYSNVSNPYLASAFYSQFKNQVELEDKDGFFENIKNKLNKDSFDIKADSVTVDEDKINEFDSGAHYKYNGTETFPENIQNEIDNIANIAKTAIDNKMSSAEKLQEFANQFMENGKSLFESIKLKDVSEWIKDIAEDVNGLKVTDIIDYLQDAEENDIKDTFEKIDFTNPIEALQTLKDFITNTVETAKESLDDKINDNTEEHSIVNTQRDSISNDEIDTDEP